jgi:rhodanese-related sulfurtransferase
MQTNSLFLNAVEHAKQQIKQTNVAEVYQRLQAEDDFYLVDVREDLEWQKGHLPNAIHIGKGVLECHIEKIIPNQNAAIVLYCGGGYRSALAALALQNMGYTQVVSMDGGVHGWCQMGLPLTAD